MIRGISGSLMIFGVVIIMVLLYSGCSTTKYVPENERLLARVEIKNDARDVSRDDLKSYQRQQENLRIIGFWKLYLGIYNISGKDTSKGINRWLRNIGEAPVIFDSTLVDRSVEQMGLFMRNRGYFHAQVDDTIRYPSPNKARVTYNISSGPRYRLNDVSYRIDDKGLEGFVLNDTTNSILRRGRGFTSEMHNRERDRITAMLQDNGFFNFSKAYIYFLADSSIGGHRINDTLVIMRPPENVAGRTAGGDHAQYTIRNVYFQVDMDPQDISFSETEDVLVADTLNYEGVYILYDNELEFKPDVLTNSNYIVPGDLYRASLVERTQSLLSALRVFKYINIRFRDVDGQVDEEGRFLLDCVIQVLPGKYQSYSVEVEGTNSSGNLGAAGNFKYQHKNIFRGAELFTLNTRLARQNQFVIRAGDGEQFNTVEMGADVSVVFPKFFMPFRIEKFRQRYNPKTTIALAYNYQRRPDYTRTIANARLGYTWRSSRFSSHSLFPLDFNLVNIPTVSSAFWEYIERNPFLRYTYEDHLIANLNYSYIYNEQQLGRGPSDFWYFRFTAESAGNTLDLLAPLWNSDRGEGYNTVLGIRYAQYFKTDVDIRFHNSLGRFNSITYRVFGGIGIPYGNLNVLPFEKRYFSGGANSIRAWPVRSIGPGTFKDVAATFYNQTADIKLEMNVEYRFPLFWLLEGALFVDAGNIWGLRDEVSPEGGLFQWDTFYKQLAVGTGFGTRLDFNFFIFRIDTGLKLHDPAAIAGEKWIPFNRKYTWGDVAFNFAIGYPF